MIVLLLILIHATTINPKFYACVMLNIYDKLPYFQGISLCWAQEHWFSNSLLNFQNPIYVVAISSSSCIQRELQSIKFLNSWSQVEINWANFLFQRKESYKSKKLNGITELVKTPTFLWKLTIRQMSYAMAPHQIESFYTQLFYYQNCSESLRTSFRKCGVITMSIELRFRILNRDKRDKRKELNATWKIFVFTMHTCK